jgi:hypothetical protein
MANISDCFSTVELDIAVYLPMIYSEFYLAWGLGGDVPPEIMIIASHTICLSSRKQVSIIPEFQIAPPEEKTWIKH